eukprot:4166902-Pleurochrysis_carterae.AAC.1
MEPLGMRTGNMHPITSMSIVLHGDRRDCMQFGILHGMQQNKLFHFSSHLAQCVICKWWPAQCSLRPFGTPHEGSKVRIFSSG